MNKETKVCTIGGGTGMPVINKSLIRAGLKNISSIVTIFDSGGDSGRMRTDERGNIMAFSDFWRSLMSLWKDGGQKVAWNDMLSFRDGRSRNFGNLFFQFMSEKAEGLENVSDLFQKLTGAGIMGQVIPVANQPADIMFTTVLRKRYRGEHNFDDLRMSLDRVKKIWLYPKVLANKKAIETIIKAEVIIICPGSMYGSVMTNLLPKGVAEAYKKSKAKKILITNIMSAANENDGYDQGDYVKVFEKYLKVKQPFDLVVVNNLTGLNEKLLEKTLKYYQMEHSYPIKYNKKITGFKTIWRNLCMIEKKNYRLRHDERKLAKIFSDLNI